MIRLPGPLQRSLRAAADAMLQPRFGPSVDFTRPAGEPALVGFDSLSWRIFKNPIALLVGGIAAVILELAEPAVRTGVWEHSSFLADPLGRLQRTGMAAMVTVYGARSVAEPMIAGVVRMHSRVAGTTSSGEVFHANDARLLRWVQATATFGFGEAYSRYVQCLDPEEWERLYVEGGPAARLYGACDAPHSRAAAASLFESMHERLERSAIVFEFLDIMRRTSALPAALRWMQPLLVRAAVDLVPPWIRLRLGLGAALGLNPVSRGLIRLAGAAAERLVLPEAPPALACTRLGLPASYLYEDHSARLRTRRCRG
jgi:uncharacterized protein (DUF2236 family)